MTIEDRELDLTDRDDELAETLREVEERYRRLFDSVGEGVALLEVICDDSGRPCDMRLLEANPAFERLTGLAARDIIGRTVLEVLPRTESVWIECYGRVALSGEPEHFEEFSAALGRHFEVRAHAVGNGRCISSFSDITERKAAEAALHENQLRYETFLNSTDDMAFLKDEELRYVMVNAANAAYFGRSVDETIGMTDADLMPSEAAGRCRITDVQALESGGVVISTEDVDGRIYETRKFPVTLAADRVGIGGYVRDITESRLAEKRLAAVSRQWRETFDAMSDSVALFDGEGRVLRCNAATTELTGRGFDDIVGRRCYEVFHGSDACLTGCPQQSALRSGQTETITVELDGRWLRIAFQPLTDEQGGVGGGVHVVTDVSDLKRAEQGLLESLATQQTITDGVIAALARTVEVRDPYTAGHQRRVSELGAAMAQAMGLEEARVDGVRVAGMLHDVGKITIPAEILSKPGRLTAMEFQLIKGHAQSGFDILESIHFPWLVAQMTVQHHERQDGSGYPAGLSGDEILLEARILAVADVVEAMASHRPYRAALGVEAALAEVRSGARTRFEAAAVEACDRVFAEGFAFSEA
jgi:PAS domain S-box-containing protein/putative nucleotidyltransferase with HDIG domain